MYDYYKCISILPIDKKRTEQLPLSPSSIQPSSSLVQFSNPTIQTGFQSIAYRSQAAVPSKSKRPLVSACQVPSIPLINRFNNLGRNWKHLPMRWKLGGPPRQLKNRSAHAHTYWLSQLSDHVTYKISEPNMHLLRHFGSRGMHRETEGKENWWDIDLCCFEDPTAPNLLVYG